jgi:hypothetical protein
MADGEEEARQPATPIAAHPTRQCIHPAEKEALSFYGVEAYLSARSFVSNILEATTVNRPAQQLVRGSERLAEGPKPARNPALAAGFSIHLCGKRLSPCRCCHW